MAECGDRKRATAVMCFSSGNGGMERSAVRLAGFLSQIAEVTLLCKHGSFIEDLCRRESAKTFRCETVRFSSRTFSPAMIFRVRALLRERQPRNVIFFGASELKSLYFAFLGHDINLVVWHGTTKSRPKHDFFHRLVYSRVNCHVALSEHLLGNVRKIVPPAPEVGFRVIYPSFRIDAAMQEKSPGPRDVLRLVHIGRVAAGKGQVDAVEACRSLHEAGVAFELDLVGPPAGDGYPRELQAVIDSAPYADHVHLHGFVDEPEAYLRQADVLLFPSWGEGMPNAFIEALHFGIPCLAYANTVFPEYQRMGFHVTLAADRDRDDLSDKLLRLCERIDAEKDASRGNQALARDYFNVDRELAGWKELLE